MEYSYFNIPVINAGINNPHVAYNFSKSVPTLNNMKRLLKKYIKKTIKLIKKK
jgi:hypothetical protein